MALTHIDDPADPRLDPFRDLKHSDQSGKGLVIAEGPLIVRRLLESRYPVRAIVGFAAKIDTFLAEEGVPELVADLPIYVVSRELLAEVAGFDMHRGLLAAADRAEPATVAEALEGAKTIAILEGVGDHENIGSIFRNAAGMEVDAILFGAACADPLYRRSVRVSMGHVLRLPFAYLDGSPTTWHHSLKPLVDDGWRLISLTPNTETLLKGALADNPEKVAFLVGSEGPGLTERAMRATQVRAKIPMAEGTDSLNLATAAAIAFYERQRAN
ncbi:TrmH family RNA methyltransferase [Corynebacterium epidermidicanis]|uniref:rRNA methylase n=1 Tax=Corynebacterium epidermidicanis TaxID=1050174 RepID=A0A0G3GNC0_9CORY|nr:RNA methyltransferase [Corynebacterium epidermidicanis]AKK02609.1 rRNA methylase [Corynebacterium epidermidicanis]